MTLACSNPDCASHEKDERPAFTINVTVGEDRDLTENLHHLEPEYFTCVYCHSKAIEGEDQ